MRGFNCLLYINDEPVSAQIDASLERTVITSDITNQITLEWMNSLVHLKQWRVHCNGAFVLNNNAMKALENAFVNGDTIQIHLTSPSISYFGEGIITSFPIGADYNQEMTYRIEIQGKGSLTQR